MGSSKFLVLDFIIFVNLVSLATAQPSFISDFCSTGNGNYTMNSPYRESLGRLLSNLTYDIKLDTGFYSSSDGQNLDKASVIALCRGDINQKDCFSCLNDSAIMLKQQCPSQKEAIGWYDYCMLRYSNRSILGGVMESEPTNIVFNLNKALDPEVFNSELGILLRSIGMRTASQDSSFRKFATGDGDVGFQRMYGLLQCTPDLSTQQCENCLNSGIEWISTNMNGNLGASILKPSCLIKYETYRFYNATASQPPTRGVLKRNTSQTVIIIVVPITIVIIFVMWVCLCIVLRLRKTVKDVENMDEITNARSLHYGFSIIKIATDNFSDANKLGQGGFGVVYKGRLSDGQEIAVKRLSLNSGQANVDFTNEVVLVAKLHHRNLIRLLGFTSEGNERLLIYELARNASLDHFIFDPMTRAYLDWDMRYKIIGGIARGLLYLHEDSHLRIIHRDLKASNILLDEDLNPKISDFGMARMFIEDQTHDNTSKIVGTFGYMPPEYAVHGQFSVKSDVFSFGVLILEILSGQKINKFVGEGNAENLLTLAWKKWRQGTALDLIDPAMRNGSTTEKMRCIHIGLLCVQENVEDRPTIASVVFMLSSYSLTFPIPSRPAFLLHSRTGPDSTEFDGLSRGRTVLSANEASNTDPYPR